MLISWAQHGSLSLLCCTESDVTAGAVSWLKEGLDRDLADAAGVVGVP